MPALPGLAGLCLDKRALACLNILTTTKPCCQVFLQNLAVFGKCGSHAARFVFGYRVIRTHPGFFGFPHMTPLQLPNYLRANRKRLALSQDEVAFLIGTKSGTKVCRDERYVRAPNLETALAYEVIFKRTVSELFSGLYQKAEREVAARAKTLAARKDSRKANRRTARKHEALLQLAAL